MDVMDSGFVKTTRVTHEREVDLSTTATKNKQDRARPAASGTTLPAPPATPLPIQPAGATTSSHPTLIPDFGSAGTVLNPAATRALD
ncbi:hypothetical protein ANO11243_031530 [Dothideomycetidae sp. 11243]|nr:hypothetical protein ANO11243_031530 [fungal sp. No.11243]